MRRPPSGTTDNDRKPLQGHAVRDEMRPNGKRKENDKVVGDRRDTNAKEQEYKQINGTQKQENKQISGTQEQGYKQIGGTQKQEYKQISGTREQEYKQIVRPHQQNQQTAQQSPWSCSILTLFTSFTAVALLITIIYSFLHLQQEPKGCQMSYMRPIFERFADFDTEHTRFASKYSLYLYREYGVDEDIRVKGVPVIFIPGNAGSYKQVRPIAAEAAVYYQEALRDVADKRPLDFFSVDFNEDITAFHGQTLLDQAEYLNEAIAFILALYHNQARSERDPDLPEPQSVIVIGHSMGGVVARTMLTMPNYQQDSITTIFTLSAPHARPPVSFDAEMVLLYHRVNTYWRESFSASPNPLTDVSIISMAGGGLDTMIPSEYTSLTSIVPESNGFTVFTSGIPNVWTSMDHLAIMWCDQLRKALVKTIFDVVDVKSRSQTVGLDQRMAKFRHHLLTGLESPSSYQGDDHDSYLLRVDRIEAQQQLSIPLYGNVSEPTVHFLAIQPNNLFSLMTDQSLTLLLCKEGATKNYDHVIDLARQTGKALACSLVTKAVLLPASTFTSTNSFDNVKPFSYYHLDDNALSGYQYVALVETSVDSPQGFVLAEVVPSEKTSMTISKGHHEILMSGLKITPPASRAMMMEFRIPEVHSTLFAYTLSITQSPCVGLFSPLLRQHIAEPYESKYFVNTAGGSINVHGVSPYMPPSLDGGTSGLLLQLWTDPTCNSTVEINLKLDRLGSAGKIVMRYRTVAAVLPLLVILVVIRQQFKVYDRSGVFISFSASMDHCIRTSVPFVFLALTFLSISLSKASQGSWTYAWLETNLDFEPNDLMLGTQDPFLWFLVPLFGIISIGVCICANYLVIAVMSILSMIYGWFEPVPITFTYQRVLSIIILLLLITTLVPYQFGYAVLVMVQVARTVRNLHVARSIGSIDDYNFFNYSHSLTMLLLWVLPINVPVLVVWVHNLAVHWLTPFSTHHNLLAIMPLVACVELVSTGYMVPRTTGWMRHITNALLFVFALYAAVFGVSYAYQLHYLLNAVAAWLIVIYLTQRKNSGSAADTTLAKQLRISGKVAVVNTKAAG